MTKIIITSAQCRAARELLNWNQETLSEKSGVSQGAISNFERSTSQREMRLGTLIDIIEAFEKEGVNFIGEGGRVGVFVEGE